MEKNLEKINKTLFTSLSPFAKSIIKILGEHGFDVYAVGGFVRDSVLGIKNKDIDITTSATPMEILEVFRDIYPTLETGIKYGTVTVISSNEKIEVTTFRSEKGYTDSRHPGEVIFEKELSKDLSRRDFTINAMAYNDNKGLIDIYGGISDLKLGLIRCVGKPTERFDEDALRMMRAVRFATRLNFKIEEITLNGIREKSQLIENVSAERINAELTQMLIGKKPSFAIMLLKDTGLLEKILPEIDDMKDFDQKNPYHPYDLLTHTLKALDNTDENLPLRLAALFHDTGKVHTMTIDDEGIGHFYGHEKISEEITKTALRRLKYPNSVISLTSRLVAMHQFDPVALKIKGVRRIVSKLGEENARLLASLQYADSSATNIKNPNVFKEKLDKFLEKEKAFSKKDLAIDGKDMIELGLSGKKIGAAINAAFELALDDPSKNEKGILLEYVKGLRL